MTELKRGSQGAEVGRWFDYFAGTATRKGWAASYSFLLGKRDLYYGADEESFTRELQRRLGVPQTGRFGDLEASRTGYRWTGTSAPPVVERRKIWIFTAPGSGADFTVGPSWQLGRMLEGLEFNEPGRQSLHINHQPLKFEKGGYLGFLGGNPEFSYVEVTFSQLKSLENCLDTNPDVQEALRLLEAGTPVERLELELWFSGYSQSADGMEDALEVLFGDGGFVHPGDKTRTPAAPGKYRALRSRINGVVQFGNPSKERTGIAGKRRPAWLAPLVRNVTATNDFYAEAPDEIRRAFYAIIIQAELELPFFVHVLRIALPIILAWAATVIPFIGPLLGGFGPMVQLALGMISGLQGVSQSPLMGNMLGQADTGIDRDIDGRLLALLSPTGVLQNIPGLIALLAALPGLQAHGEYHLPKPEWGGRTGFQVGYDIVAAYRRP